MKFYKEKFKSIRKSQGWSSEALSNVANISRQSISKWENGKSIPSFKKIQQLAKVLGVNASEISDITSHPISEIKVSEKIQLKSDNITTTNKDIKVILSSLKQIDKSLNESSMLLKAILVHTNHIIYVKDPDQRYVIVNRSFLQTLSLVPEYNVKGRYDSDFYSKQEAQENTLEDEEVLRSGKPIVDKERYISGTRKQKWGIFSKTPIIDDNNNIIGLLGVIFDITARKKQEKHTKVLEYAISKSKETIWVAKGINVNPDTPALFKELLYLSVSTSQNKNCKAFWGNVNPRELSTEEVLKGWWDGLNEKEKEQFKKNKTKLTLPTTLHYNLISPITQKEIWVTENIEYDKENEYFWGSISYNSDILKLKLFKEIINETPNLIVWIGSYSNNEESFKYQYLSNTEEITGYKTSYFTNGNVITDLAIKPDLGKAIMQDFIKDKFPFSHKYKIKTKYGKELTVKSFYYKFDNERVFPATYYGFHFCNY